MNKMIQCPFCKNLILIPSVQVNDLLKGKEIHTGCINCEISMDLVYRNGKISMSATKEVSTNDIEILGNTMLAKF